MLIVEQLRAGYGRIPILHGLSFAVSAGETVGILGHNGMGKTTLIKTVMGIVQATGGSIRFEGQDITRLRPHRRARVGLGYVPQGREIFPALSVRENLHMGALNRREGARAVVEEVLERVPRLRRLLERRGGALSGGEQQLLAIARCLCSAPRVMLLDEPTEGIQPSIIDEIQDLLDSLRRDRALSVVLVEQNLDFIRALSDRVLVIQRGEIATQLDPERLGDPDLVSEFLGMSAKDARGGGAGEPMP